MKITDIITFLEHKGTWINWERTTRDRILYGNKNQNVKKIGICWVATNKVIEFAIQNNINFIISHENIFYTTGTNLETKLIKSIEYKKKLLDKGNICVYRCHDVWDLIEKQGVSDSWAKKLGFSFKKEKKYSYYQYADVPPQKVKDLALHIAKCLEEDGENGVYVFGDTNKQIKRVSIGTGAANNIFEMLQFDPDVLIVSDDGITNFKDAQFIIDNNLAMIVVNHVNCEICGVKNMATYLQNIYPNIDINYLNEGLSTSYFKV